VRRALSRRLGLGALLLALLALAVRPAEADYKQDYLKAREALDKGSWAEAATLLRRAIQEEPQENARVKFYGVRLEPYLPHYHLGEALVKLGQCDQAVSELAESERQGVVQGLATEYGLLKGYRDECRAAAPRPSPVVPVAPGPPPTPTPTAVHGDDPRLLKEAQQRAQAAVTAASRAEEAAKGQRRKPDYAPLWEQRADLVRRLDQAAANLERARALQGKETVAELESAASLAADARKELEAVQQAATTARDQAASAGEQARDAHRQELLGEIQVLLGPAESLLADGGRLSPSARAGLERELRSLELVVNEARSPAGLSVMRLESIKDQLGAASRDLEQALQRAGREATLPTPGPSQPTLPTPPVPPPPGARAAAPPELRSAVAAFLRADYRTVLGALEHIDFPQPHAESVAFLFRAAAHYLLFLESGQRNAGLKEEATADVRAMRAKDPGVAPLPEVFSPLFIEFCNQVR
jgi:hypothetical protein